MATRSRLALSAQRAWEIAVAVANPIRGGVQLTQDYFSERIDSREYAWIDITVPNLTKFPEPQLRHLVEWVTRAREACIVWHMLACCEGFSGYENERFWKRLIDEAARYHPDDPRFIRVSAFHASDEDSLSPTPPTVTGLPRFRLVLLASASAYDAPPDPWVFAAIRAFVGIGDTTARSSSTVQGYVSSLLPHVDETQLFEHAVEICFRMRDAVPRLNVTNAIHALSTDVESRSRETTPAQRKADLMAGTIWFPVVTFKDFVLELDRPIESDDVVAELLQIFRTVGNIVTVLRCAIEPKRGQMSEEALSSFMEILRGSASRTLVSVQDLALFYQEASRRQREIVFSSLPVISVKRFSADWMVGNDQTMGEHDWTWLAFGLYHPWAMVRKFDMTALDLSERNASPMKSIASAHASLYRLYYGEEDDTVPQGTQGDLSDRVDWHYTVVTVRAATTCYKSASLQGERLCELNDEITLTAVIKYATRDVDQLPAFVCVVVPTRGHGWIPQTSVASLSWLRATGASIQHIALREFQWNPSIPFSSFEPLLQNVSSLDLSRWDELSASRLLELLRICPKLKRLHVEHRGDLWHEWDDNTAGEDAALKNLQLHELSLRCRNSTSSFRAPSKTAWNTCLRRLSSFHITTSSSTKLHQEAVRDAYQRGYTVEQFVWHTCLRFDSDSKATYEEGRANTRKLLKITKGKNDKAQLPFSVEARLAFASVIKRMGEEKDGLGDDRRLRPRWTKQQFEGLGKLSQEIARLICEFATTDVERRVWVYR